MQKSARTGREKAVSPRFAPTHSPCHLRLCRVTSPSHPRGESTRREVKCAHLGANEVRGDGAARARHWRRFVFSRVPEGGQGGRSVHTWGRMRHAGTVPLAPAVDGGLFSLASRGEMRREWRACPPSGESRAVSRFSFDRARHKEKAVKRNAEGDFASCARQQGLRALVSLAVCGANGGV